MSSPTIAIPLIVAADGPRLVGPDEQGQRSAQVPHDRRPDAEEVERAEVVGQEPQVREPDPETHHGARGSGQRQGDERRDEQRRPASCREQRDCRGERDLRLQRADDEPDPGDPVAAHPQGEVELQRRDGHDERQGSLEQGEQERRGRQGRRDEEGLLGAGPPVGDPRQQPPEQPGEEGDLDGRPDEVALVEAQHGQREERQDEVGRVVERVQPGLELAAAEHLALDLGLDGRIVQIGATALGDDRPARVEGAEVGLVGGPGRHQARPTTRGRRRTRRSPRRHPVGRPTPSTSCPADDLGTQAAETEPARAVDGDRGDERRPERDRDRRPAAAR